MSANTIVEKETTTLPIPKVHLELMRNTEQNPKYHAEGNVLNHTLLVLGEFYDLAGSTELSPSEKVILYWAALLHDIGKPSVTRFDGVTWRSSGHEKAGVPIARNILMQQADVSPEERQNILDLVRYHHLPLRMGLKGAPLEAYQGVAFQTDIRLLGLFALMDLQGRMCENAHEIQDLVYQFNEEIVPKIEATWGTHTDIQRRYKACCPLIKNQIWNALKQGKYDKIHSLLATGRAVSSPRSTCYIAIGTPKSGKTAYFKKYYGQLPVFEEEKSPEYRGALSQALRDFLTCNLSYGQDVVIDGCHLNVLQRQQIADFVRRFETEIQYIFFERSLPGLLRQNSYSQQPTDPGFLKQAYAQLLMPHPWEAHSLQIV